MVALLVFLIILADVLIALLFVVVSLLIIIFLRLKSALLLILSFGTKAGLCLTHLVEFVALSILVLKYFILLITLVLLLKFLNDSLSLLFALRVFEIVHVELILQVVNVRILLHIDIVEAFELLFQTFVLLLVLRLHILDSFKSLFSTLKLSSPALDLVLKLGFVLAELADGFNHFAHLLLLRVNNVPDALLNVLLFRISV